MNRPLRFPAVALFLLAATLPAQTVLYVPDPNPTVPGGTSGNAFPFGSGTQYTYMNNIPAANMDPQNTRLDDLSFAPVPTVAAGVWNASDCIIAVGHLPTPMPCPFPFPGPGAATLGAFLDLTVIYDASVHPPLNWTWNPGAWSPMNLPAVVGQTSFIWNGINDVGIYITFQGSTKSGAFLRSTTIPPSRTYANTYQAATSTACNATSAIVTGLHMSPASNLASISQSGPGIGDLSISLLDLSTTATEGYLLLSADVAGSPGGGPFLGISPDANTWLLLTTTPLGVGNPFHFPAVAPPGFFPASPFNLGPGSTSALTGLTVDVVFLMLSPGPLYDSKSNNLRFTFQ